jgi:hypothetical protein
MEVRGTKGKTRNLYEGGWKILKRVKIKYRKIARS